MSKDIPSAARDQLDVALVRAESLFAQEGAKLNFNLSDRCRIALDALNARAQAASAVFTNIITCLAIKSARPDVDVRYHQTQIQKDTQRSAGVNFRGISEDVIYPWLDRNRFEGAKSGWQTRTLERPKPYTMDYAENIAYVKNEFLTVFDELEEQGQSAPEALAYLIYKQVIRREEVRITLSVPKTQDIATIVEMLRQHFFKSYKGSKGASRLPVLALHAIYSVMVHELKRYEGKSVCQLNEHSAADSQTGSIGDIEVKDDATGEIFEAVEVKHDLPITEVIAADVQQKVMDKSIARYYILTTHTNCEPDDGAKKIIDNIKSVYDCQVIANGVMSSIRYYLRLLADPSAIFPVYVDLLQKEKAIAHEHRTGWNDVVSGIKG